MYVGLYSSTWIEFRTHLLHWTEHVNSQIRTLYDNSDNDVRPFGFSGPSKQQVRLLTSRAIMHGAKDQSKTPRSPTIMYGASGAGLAFSLCKSTGMSSTSSTGGTPFPIRFPVYARRTASSASEIEGGSNRLNGHKVLRALCKCGPMLDQRGRVQSKKQQ